MKKTQLIIAINFISSKDNDEGRVMHSKSDSIEIVINDKANEFMEELFQSFLSRYQIRLETSVKGSDFIFGCANLLYYKCQKASFKRGGSYIDSPDWVKDKKAAINLVNRNDDKCFQYAVTIALNHEEIQKDPQRITKIKPFINKYN